MILNRTASTDQTFVTASEAMDHLLISPDDWDAHLPMVSIYLAAAVSAVAEMTGRAINLETWVQGLRAPCGAVALAKSPVRAVTAISYYDGDNVLQSADLADYRVTLDGDISLVEPVGSWPTTYVREDAVKITFTAGYTTLPPELRAAILLKLGDLHAHRGDDEAGQSDRLIEGLASLQRLSWIAA